jgi:ferritin-like metal-binding protein YciE
MGFFTRDIKTIDDLFVHALRDIYYAEHQIMQSLPDMIENAHDPQLKQRLHAHLGETINHIDRLEDVFSLYGTDPRHLNCPAIDGIIAEAEDVTGEADEQAIDAAIIAAAQALEHYEITRYGSLIAWAKRLDREDCAAILDQNLQEEQAADQRLAELAERDLDLRAA